MKTIELLPTEFYQFKRIAEDMRILFFCYISGGMYFVEANIDHLHKIGY